MGPDAVSLMFDGHRTLRAVVQLHYIMRGGRDGSDLMGEDEHNSSTERQRLATAVRPSRNP